MSATKATQDSWLAHAVGRAMNPDNAYGLQCKDVPDDYIDTFYGKGAWIRILKPGNAKDVYKNADPRYFAKIPNNPHDPHQIPPRGSIVVFSGTRAVPEGHTAVVDSSDQTGMTVIQQDGYVQYPAKRVRLPYVLPNGASLIGWLIPKLEPAKKMATQKEIEQAYRDILERTADAGGIKHYLLYPIDFVRADLKASAAFKNLQARKAAAAKAAADTAKKKAAMQAEAQRVAEEKAAAERLKEQAEQQERAAREAAAALETEAANVSTPPIVADPASTLETFPTQPPQPPLPTLPSLSVWQQFLLWFNEHIVQARADKKKE